VDQKAGWSLERWRNTMAGKDYRDLIAWKKGFELVLNIYEKTVHFPVEEKYGITA
jgi:hypothetical protein